MNKFIFYHGHYIKPLEVSYIGPPSLLINGFKVCVSGMLIDMSILTLKEITTMTQDEAEDHIKQIQLDFKTIIELHIEHNNKSQHR